MTFPSITERDRKTIRYASIGLGIYITLFGGWQVMRFLGRRHAEYGQLLRESANLKNKFELYDARVIRLRRLMESFQMDPAQLTNTTLVARATAAIQQSAAQGGLQLGPIRESLSRASERELGTIQLEVTGQVPAIMSFAHRLRSLGFPVVIDTLNLSSDAKAPGQVKLSLSLILLNYEQWDAKEIPNA